jgi:hypothetical protein
MRVLTVLAVLLLAACAAPESQHPGNIGGEQAVKNSGLLVN